MTEHYHSEIYLQTQVAKIPMDSENSSMTVAIMLFYQIAVKIFYFFFCLDTKYNSLESAQDQRKAHMICSSTLHIEKSTLRVIYVWHAGFRR